MNESEQQRYNQALIEWRQTVDEFETAIMESAEMDAQYKHRKARAIVKAKHEEPKAPAVLVEAIADADDDVAAAYVLRLVKGAAADALKRRLEWHRANADNLRTQVVDAREHNRMASGTGAGPGWTSGPDAPRSGPTRPATGRGPQGGYDEAPPRREPATDPWGGR